MTHLFLPLSDSSWRSHTAGHQQFSACVLFTSISQNIFGPRNAFQWQWQIFRPPHRHRWHYKASGSLPGRIIQTCVCATMPLLPFLLFFSFFLSKGSIRAASRMARYSGVTVDLFSGRLLLLGGWRAHKSRGLILLNRSLKRRAVITVHASAELKHPPPPILRVNSSYWRRWLLSRSKWGFYF